MRGADIRRFPRCPVKRFVFGLIVAAAVAMASNRIRYVLVVLELKSRKPVKILKIQHSYLSFDPEGRLREDEREKAARLDAFGRCRLSAAFSKKQNISFSVNAHNNSL